MDSQRKGDSVSKSEEQEEAARKLEKTDEASQRKEPRVHHSDHNPQAAGMVRLLQAGAYQRAQGNGRMGENEATLDPTETT